MENNTTRDFYKELELSSDKATESEIRNAYIQLALKYHPDRNTSNSSVEKFKSIAEAYFVLSDSTRRATYDQARRKSSGGGVVSSYTTGVEKVDSSTVFGGVFNDLLTPEMENPSWFYTPLGTVAGAILGGIILNVPGMVAGGYFGSKMGSIRDAKNMSVYDAFCNLETTKRQEILISLAKKIGTSVL